MLNLLYLTLAVHLVASCAQSPETTKLEDMKRFAKQVVERALDFQEGSVASLKDAQNDFTADGWKSFLEHEQISPNDGSAPQFSSEFTASAEPVIISNQAGTVSFGIAGVLAQSQGGSRTRYRVVVYIQAQNEPQKIKALELTTCGGASTTKRCEVDTGHTFSAR